MEERRCVFSFLGQVGEYLWSAEALNPLARLVFDTLLVSFVWAAIHTLSIARRIARLVRNPLTIVVRGECRRVRAFASVQ